MKWLLFRCFLGTAKSKSDVSDRSPQNRATLPHSDAPTTTSSDALQATTEPQQAQEVTTASERAGVTSEASTNGAETTGRVGNEPVPSSEKHEVQQPRLSLDCGIGPAPSFPPSQDLLASPNASFSRHPTSHGATFAYLHCGNVASSRVDPDMDTGPISDSSSGALTIRSGAAAAALTGPPGDLTMAGSRHQVSRCFHGRASLDTLLMLGALMRAADESISMAGLSSLPRLERIESGDLPPGEDGHVDQPLQSPKMALHTMEAPTGVQVEWGAQVADANFRGRDPLLTPCMTQRRGACWPLQPSFNGNSSGGTGGGGDCPVLDMSSGSALTRVRASHAASDAHAPSNAVTAATAADVDRFADPHQFTFPQPSVTSSQRQSIETGWGPHSDMSLTLPYPPMQLYPHSSHESGSQIHENHQVLEMFMRLVTNCSTVGDNDPTTSSFNGDRSSNSAGNTATVHSALTLPPPQLPPRLMAAGTMNRRSAHPHLQRSISARARVTSNHRMTASEGPVVVAGMAMSNGSTVALQGATTSASSRTPTFNTTERPPEGGSSAPLARLHGKLRTTVAATGGCSVGGLGLDHSLDRRGCRRNSWDTQAGSSGSAVAMAAAAAAAMAAAGLLTRSRSARATGNGLGTGGGSGGRFWPMGGVLQEESGPTSLLLLGALSGGMSHGANNSSTSLVRLPTGSGSVRDVLSRIQQQQLMLQEVNPAATSSSSWSTHTGMASLFDAHLTEALRCTGAVRTFQRAVGGNLSRASSGGSQLMGNLGRQDTSLTLTSGLMMFNFSSTCGSSAVAPGTGGISQLGAASTRMSHPNLANSGGGFFFSGICSPPPRPRRATISSISTINSVTCDIPVSGDGDDGDPRSSVRLAAAAAAASTAAPLLAAGTRHLGNRSGGVMSDGGMSDVQSYRAQMQWQLRGIVEGLQPQIPHPHPYHHQQQQHGRQVQQVQPSRPCSPGRSPDGLGTRIDRALSPGQRGVALRGARATAWHSRPPPLDLVRPDVHQQQARPGDALSLAFGIAVASDHNDISPPQHSLPPLLSAELVATRAMAAGALAAGPIGSTWLQLQDIRAGHRAGGSGGGLAAGRELGTGAEQSTSIDFSRFSWDTEWGPTGGGLRGADQVGDTFTFTGAGSNFSQAWRGSAAYREGTDEE